MRPTAALGCARGFVVGALLALAAVDLNIVADDGGSLQRPAVVLAAGLAAALWPARRRPRWLTPQLRTAVPAVLSLLYTADVALQRRDAPFGPGEIALLLWLLFTAVRHCPPRWAIVCGLLDAAAVLLTPARYYRPLWSSDEASGYELVALVLIGVVAGLAGYLRSLDFRRTVAVADTRREERVAMAADLHDFVAHHVTGILVQTQMARMMAASSEPADLDPVLAGIERAATEALSSMRRTVGVLRAPDPADHRPVGDLAGIAELTEGFATPGQRVTLRRAPDVHDDVPHEVQAAAFRIVQEALTNVRRHAADATEVTVELRRADAQLEVTITDDGRGGTQLPAAARGGGFGLVGLRERVTALGGELRTGPGEGEGWRVRAVLPMAQR